MSDEEIQKKREKESQIVNLMISLYCKKKHKNKNAVKGELCPACDTLKNYAKERIEKCPFMETKTFCSKCKVHCYKNEMREKIKGVMRFSGPRIMFYHPILVIKHAVCK